MNAKAASAAPPPKARKPGIREDAINLPNMLTFARIVMIPLILWLISIGTPQANFWAAIIYTATAVTDFLDGWLARRRGLVSVLGKFLDPLADKLLVMAVLVYLVQLGQVPSWMVILIVARELSITSLRVIAMSEGVVIAASRGGKDKTAIQMTSLMFLILHHSYDITFFGLPTTHLSFNLMGVYMLFVSVVLAFTSAGEYIKLFVEAVEAKEERLHQQSEDTAERED